jgi:glycosyltransferase involved in cell wall biosynthesis
MSIESVLGQTLGDLEVVVVDDGSTDSTADVAQTIRDPRVQVVSQSNRGLSAARNAGIAAARGKYIALLDSDDLYLPRYLELSRQALESAPDVGFTYADGYVFDSASGKVRVRTAMARSRPPVPPPTDAHEFLFELLQRNFILAWTVMPRTVLEAIGGFDESLGSAEDYELWLRILLSGYRAVLIPGQHVLYRRHAGQMTKALVTMSDQLAAVYEKLDIDKMPSAAHRELLLKRRRDVRRQTKILARTGWAVPLSLVIAAKRAGIGERWYDPPPQEIVDAFGDLKPS